MRKPGPGQAWWRAEARRRSTADFNRNRRGLSLSGVEESLHADDLAVEGTGNERVALDLPVFGVRDGDAVDFESTSHGAFVVGLRFHEIREGAEFGALRGDQVALRQNDVINRRSAELILLLFGVEGLFLQLAGFAGGLHARAILPERNIGIADI